MLYPPVVLGLAPPAAAVMAVEWRRRRPRGAVAFATHVLAAGGMLAVTYLRPYPLDIGPPFSGAQIATMPEWQTHGRFPYFVADWQVYYFNGPIAGLGVSPTLSLVAVVLLVLTVARWPRAIPLEGWALLVGSLALWALAHAVLLKLYFPSRYTLYTLPVFAIVWAAGVTKEMAQYSLPTTARRVGSAALIIAAAIAIAVDVRAGVAFARGPGSGSGAAGMEAAYAFVRRLPKKTLVAAHPDDADFVPLRTRRSVLVSTEIALPIHTQYYATMKQRTNDAFDLLYATDWPTIDRIAKRDKIDVFLLDQNRLLRPTERPYLRPFDRGNTGRIARAADQGFAMLSPPAGRVLFAKGDVLILKLNRGRP